MYPDLSYLFHDLIGTDLDNALSAIKMFGFMLAMAFLGSGYVLKKELHRFESEGSIKPIKKKIKQSEGFQWAELIINGLVALIIGTKLPFIFSNFDNFKADPASIIFSKEGNWAIGLIALALYAAYYIFSTKGKDTTIQEKDFILHPHQKTSDIVIVSAISGVLGARIFSILENLDGFTRDPLGTLFSGSGLTVYGGVIVGTLVVYLYIKRLGIPPRKMMDASALAILMGLAIGRLGCQLSGDGDWGIVAAAQPEWWFLPDWLWSYSYPNNVANDNALLEGCDSGAYNLALRSPGASIESACQEACGFRYCHELKEGVYPTPIYEVVLYLLGFGLLWIWRKKFKVAGTLFFLYMIYNGIVRFIIEEIRVNDKYDLLGMHLSQAQYISILFVLAGIGGILYFNKKYGAQDSQI